MSHRSPARIVLVPLLALAVTLAGCGEKSPTGPGTPPQTVPPSEARLALVSATEDLLARVLPAMQASGATTQTTALADALGGLRAALLIGDAPLATPAAKVDQALLPLETAAAGSPGELAELGAVRLVLERAAELPR